MKFLKEIMAENALIKIKIRKRTPSGGNALCPNLEISSYISLGVIALLFQRRVFYSIKHSDSSTENILLITIAFIKPLRNLQVSA
jgi:hypothetical protein